MYIINRTHAHIPRQRPMQKLEKVRFSSIPPHCNIPSLSFYKIKKRYDQITLLSQLRNYNAVCDEQLHNLV